MTPDQYQQLQRQFLQIIAADQSQRAVLLESSRVQSPETYDELCKLLENERRGSNMLDRPMVTREADSEFETFKLESGGDAAVEIPSQIGPYRVLQQIGEGGHGVVFMAEQVSPIRRKVALKCVKPGMDSKAILARFDAERQALAMMNHPSIANVIDANETEFGQPYFVMELVHGIPIDKFCDENELTLNERLGLFGQVCAAVHHAHRKGIIHRDIKPNNVLVTVDSGKPLVKVIDFGIAKAMHMPLTEKTMYTEFGQIIGTLEYMSPEQALMSQSGIDIRSDVYSLGVLLYLLITGDTPLTRADLLEKGIWELKDVLQKSKPVTPSIRITTGRQAVRWRDKVQTPSAWLTRVKGDLDWITMKALSKEPGERYDSATDFARDIQNYLNGAAVAARPPTTWYRLSKFLKRNQVAVFAMSVLLLAGLVAFGGLIWGYIASQNSLKEVTKANGLVIEKAVALEKETNRANRNAKRLTGILKRQILESAWQNAIDGNQEEAIQALNDIRDQHGFAQRFVASVTRQMALPELRSKAGGPIRAIAAHPTLSVVGMITNESVLEVWDVENRTRTFQIQLPNQIFTSLEFDRDGRSILVGTSSGLVELIDMDRQKRAVSKELGKGGIRAIAFDTSRERWIVSTGANYVCSLDRENLELRSVVRLEDRISQLAVSPDGQSIAVATIDAGMFLIDLDDLNNVRRIEGLKSTICDLGWSQPNSPSESELLVCDISGNRYRLTLSKDRERSILNGLSSTTLGTGVLDAEISTAHFFLLLRDGQIVSAREGRWIPLRKFGNAPKFLKHLPGSGQLLVVHASGRVCLLAETEQRRAEAVAAEFVDLRDGLVLEATNRSLTAHADGRLKIGDLNSGEVLSSASTHRGEAYEITSQNGMVASIGSDRRIVLSQLSDLENVRILDCAWGVRCVEFSPGGLVLASAPDPVNTKELREGTIDLWDVQSGQASKRLAGHENWVTELAFVDRDKLVSLSVDGTARVWSIASGECEKLIEISYLPLHRAMAVTSNGEMVIGHDGGLITRWDLKTGRQTGSVQISGESVNGLFSPKDSGKLLVSVRASDDLVLVDTDTLTIEARLDAGIGPLAGFSAKPGGHSIQIMGESGAVRVWIFEDGNG